jgi:hypothetical protein
MPAAKPVSAAGIDAAGFQSPSRLIEPPCEWALIDWAGRTAQYRPLTKKRVLNRRWTRMDADEEGLL